MMNVDIILEEQGLRDGIQNLDLILSTDKKVEYIERLVDAGIKRIQIASFVHPKIVPQMADAEDVCKKVNKRDGVIYSGLVLNRKGVERGIEAGLNHLACSISASNTHSQKNARKTLEEARVDFKDMVKLCVDNSITPRGGIQCAFGCRYEGEVEKDKVLDLVKHHLDCGVKELALADSTGMGNPMQMEELLSKVLEETQEIPVILHLHNTENKGYANVYAALRSGIKIFDTAFGGLGGCPFIKNATGNVATEDVIHMLHQMGLQTGIDLIALVKLSLEMEEQLQRDLPGYMYKLASDPNFKLN